METQEDAAASFDSLRPRLIRVAYRMLGSVADAEDMVQEAFIRWMKADRGTVREPEAFLRRVVTRLCLDHLDSVRRRRETYIGPWLPEPFIAGEENAGLMDIGDGLGVVEGSGSGKLALKSARSFLLVIITSAFGGV